MKNLLKLGAAASAAFAVASAAALAVAQAPAAHAQSAMDHGKMDNKMTAQAPSTSDFTDGEVRKIDMEAGKITLRHAEIKNLDMPGMTMVFAVKDKAMLEKLKAGDKVKFKAIKDRKSVV